MNRTLWAIGNAVSVAIISLIAAAITHNPNWPLNIPYGLAAGAIWGLLSWPLTPWAKR
jgi:hypothetical protein